MRIISPFMHDAWLSEDKTGDKRPTIRATVQRAYNRHHQYDTFYAPGGDLEHQNHRLGSFRNLILGEPSGVRELQNIRSFTWSRGVNQDVAEGTLTLKNVELVPLGSSDPEQGADDFDLPGYMTYNRGQVANRWGYTADTGWTQMLVPDRMVKTYEGYGADYSQDPAYDPHLMQSGTWLIEDATYTADGDITLRLFDVGTMLIKQISMPPVIPWVEYPMEWVKIHQATVTARAAQGGSWKDVVRSTGAVTSSGSTPGHPATDVLDKSDNTWWMSNAEETDDDKVYWQINLSDSTTALAALRIKAKGGPYRVYVSLHNGTKWLGSKTISSDDPDEDIPFVMQTQADRNAAYDVVLPRKYGAIAKIRLTFTRLLDQGGGQFKAGLQDLQLYTAGNVSSLSFGKGDVLRTVGNYSDFTDIIKWVGAWCGWWWPPHETGQDFIQGHANATVGNRQYVTYASPDPKLAEGRVWGDFMNTGTAGEADLTLDLFDKKPMMDCINYVRDIVGFLFFIDETGGIVWRLPNLGLAGSPKLGNYLSPSQLGARTRARTSSIITLDENESLISLETTLSSKDIRDRIFVANVNGKVGTVIRGYVPNFSAFRRVAGWTDQNFKTKRECIVTADMIAAQSMFNYRRTKVRMPANPAIQIDDQIRIIEKVTNETYYHYVESISSSIDMETGEWFYDLETHWLGESPDDAWAVQVQQLDGATQNYLHGVGGGSGIV